MKTIDGIGQRMTRTSLQMVAALIFLSAFAEEADAEPANRGFVAVCKSISSQRFDYVYRRENPSYGQPGPFIRERGEESYGDHSFSFSFDGQSLFTEAGKATILIVGADGKIMAIEYGLGAANAAVSNLYSYAIFPRLGKVVMNRLQTD